MCRFVLVNTVFNDIAAGNGDNGLFPTVKICGRQDLRHFYLRNICRTGITVCIVILVDNNAGGESNLTVLITAVAGIEHDLTVKHHKAERFANAVCGITGIPRKTAVHRADYATVHILVDPVSLVKHGPRLIHRCIHF